MNRFTRRSRPARGPPTRPSWVPFASLSPSSPSACGLAAPSGAEVYRWTDPEGKVHYTSDLSRVPASQQEAAKASAGEPKGGAVMRIESRPPAKPTGPAAAPEGAPAGPEERRPRRRSPPKRCTAAATRAGGARKPRSSAKRSSGSRTQTEQCTAGEFRWSAGAGGRAYREESAEAETCAAGIRASSR